MVGDDEGDLLFAVVVDPAAQVADGGVGLEQVLGGDAADGEHDLGLDQFDLP